METQISTEHNRALSESLLRLAKAYETAPMGRAVEGTAETLQLAADTLAKMTDMLESLPIRQKDALLLAEKQSILGEDGCLHTCHVLETQTKAERTYHYLEEKTYGCIKKTVIKRTPRELASELKETTEALMQAIRLTPSKENEDCYQQLQAFYGYVKRLSEQFGEKQEGGDI